MNEATLKQVEKFRYLGVAFTRDGRQYKELDTRKINKKLSKKAKLSIFKTVFVPILNYYNESWAMTERVQSQVQAFEMRFL